MKKSFSSILLPLIFAFGTVILLLILGSSDPWASIQAFFLGPFRNLYFFGNMLDSATYIMLTGLGILLAFKGGSFNLGGEGQVYTGAFVTALFLGWIPSATGNLGVGLALVLGICTGGTLAGISALLRRYLGVNDLISSYLLSLGIIPFYDSLIAGPLRDPSSNLLTTPEIDRAFWLPKILVPSNAHIGLFVALGLGGFFFWLLQGTRRGFELRLSGSNPLAAQLVGVSASTYSFVAFISSGALHGLAGSLAVTGTYHAALVGVTSGFGWNGIAAALIGRNHPLGTLLGALFFAYLQTGARTAMIYTRFSTELAILVQGFVFLFITAQVFGKKQIRGRSLHD
ncbi:MAG: ABC transporter permease [Spirochaetales bacterium]|nr:ABC transporter permease [Spirochaetales bacterium]